MQTRRKRTETVSETTTLLFLKKTVKQMQTDWCNKCAAEVFWIEAAEISLLGISDMPDSTAKMHINGGRFCLRSLIQEVKKETI